VKNNNLNDGCDKTSFMTDYSNQH